MKEERIKELMAMRVSPAVLRSVMSIMTAMSWTHVAS